MASQMQTLLKLTVLELKQKCAEAGTPVTGTKATLVARLLDPAQHQKKAKTVGSAIRKAAPKKKKKKSEDSDVDSDSDDSLYGSGRTYCESCDKKDYIDPHNGLCGDCAEQCRPIGGCPCWRQTCEYDEDSGDFVCEM